MILVSISPLIVSMLVVIVFPLGEYDSQETSVCGITSSRYQDGFPDLFAILCKNSNLNKKG